MCMEEVQSRHGRESVKKFGGLRGLLFAEEAVWCEEINELLEFLPVSLTRSEYDGEWSVYSGLYCTGGFKNVDPRSSYRSLNNIRKSSRHTSYEESVTFSFQYSGRYHSSWVDAVSNVWVTKSTKGFSNKKEFCVCDPSELGFVKFVVGGRLIKPFVTDDIGEAAEYLSDEIPKVEDRIECLRLIEKCASEKFWPAMDHINPASVSGVGEKSMERLVKYFGAYPNILFSSESEIMSRLSTAYGNDPDLEGLISRTTEAVMAYEKRDFDCPVNIEDLQEYPYESPIHLTSSIVNTHKS